MLRPLVRRAARVAYPHGSVRRVLRGPAAGRRFVVGPAMGATYALGSGYHLDAFAGRIRPGMVVYDVGANAGQMALAFSRLVGEHGHVLCFEPVPHVHAALVANVRLNRLRNVSTRQAAAADADGCATFLFGDDPTEGRLADLAGAYPVPNGRPVEVETLRLDTVARTAAPPQVLKIDVEGGARVVLRGARELLDRHAPAVFIEIHGPDEQAAVRDELLARGYVARRLDGRVVGDPTAGWASPLWCEREP